MMTQMYRSPSHMTAEISCSSLTVCNLIVARKCVLGFLRLKLICRFPHDTGENSLKWHTGTCCIWRLQMKMGAPPLGLSPPLWWYHPVESHRTDVYHDGSIQDSVNYCRRIAGVRNNKPDRLLANKTQAAVQRTYSDLPNFWPDFHFRAAILLGWALADLQSALANSWTLQATFNGQEK